MLTPTRISRICISWSKGRKMIHQRKILKSEGANQILSWCANHSCVCPIIIMVNESDNYGILSCERNFYYDWDQRNLPIKYGCLTSFRV
mmetsp:Transcript_45227/g.66611  ORF Transcript_45227/g.66611 Transcript_45227/m.66611 type:complete len:89 (-) Transcript_45227:1786-2052(-)